MNDIEESVKSFVLHSNNKVNIKGEISNNIVVLDSINQRKYDLKELKYLSKKYDIYFIFIYNMNSELLFHLYENNNVNSDLYLNYINNNYPDIEVSDVVIAYHKKTYDLDIIDDGLFEIYILLYDKVLNNLEYKEPIKYQYNKDYYEVKLVDGDDQKDIITIVAVTKGSINTALKLDKEKYKIILFRRWLNVPSYFFKVYESILIGNKYIIDDAMELWIEIGKKAIQDSIDDIIAMIKIDKVIVLGYSGGSMSGGLPFMIEKLIEAGKKVFVITTIPCEWEGQERNNNSKIYLEKLKTITNNIYINNHREVLEELYKEKGEDKVSIIQLFKKCDEIVVNKILELTKNGW